MTIFYHKIWSHTVCVCMYISMCMYMYVCMCMYHKLVVEKIEFKTFVLLHASVFSRLLHVCLYEQSNEQQILDEMKQYKMLFCVRGYHIYWDLCIGEMPVVKTNRHNNLHDQLTVASYRIAPNVRGKKLS